MKRALSFILALMLCLSLCACGTTGSTDARNESVITEEEAEKTADTELEESSEPEEPTESEEPADPEEPAEPEEPAKSEEPASELVDGMHPEFKEAMDTYEAFYDEYCDFMKEFEKNPSDLSLLAKYGELLMKAEQMNHAFEEWNEDELNDIELKYYLEVNNRVTQKLLDVAG